MRGSNAPATNPANWREVRLTDMVLATASAVLGDLVEHPDFMALMETGLSVIRGLVMTIPVSGRDAADERWDAIRPILNRTASELLDRPATSVRQRGA